MFGAILKGIRSVAKPVLSALSSSGGSPFSSSARNFVSGRLGLNESKLLAKRQSELRMSEYHQKLGTGAQHGAFDATRLNYSRAQRGHELDFLRGHASADRTAQAKDEFRLSRYRGAAAGETADEYWDRVAPDATQFERMGLQPRTENWSPASATGGVTSPAGNDANMQILGQRVMHADQMRLEREKMNVDAVSKVASALAGDNPAISVKLIDDLITGEEGSLAKTEASTLQSLTNQRLNKMDAEIATMDAQRKSLLINDVITARRLEMDNAIGSQTVAAKVADTASQITERNRRFVLDSWRTYLDKHYSSSAFVAGQFQLDAKLPWGVANIFSQITSRDWQEITQDLLRDSGNLRSMRDINDAIKRALVDRGASIVERLSAASGNPNYKGAP